eukprot:11280146-Karenia_brevis.AAC.1
MEHAKNVEKERITSLVKEYRENMAICEGQLLDYARSLTKRNKFYIGKKGTNFDAPPTRDDGDQKGEQDRDDGDQRGPQPSQGAASSASGGIAPKRKMQIDQLTTDQKLDKSLDQH